MSTLVALMATIVVFAARTRDQEIAHLMDSARWWEWCGYIMGGLGILIVIAAIPIAIYQDRKKARRKAARAKTPPDQHSRS
jgi:uncharacterized membrane protein YdcZ (DUF606 family)